MTIKTRLQLSTVAIACIAIIIFILFNLTTQALSLDLHKSRARCELASKVFALSLLAENYALYSGDEMKIRWRSICDRIVELLHDSSDDQPLEEPALHSTLEQQREALVRLDKLASETWHEIDDTALTDQEKREWIGAQLSSQLRLLNARLRDLSDAGMDHSIKAQHLAQAVALCLLGFMVVLNCLLSYATGNSVVQSLQRLRDGASSLAEGDMDHVIEVGGKDELGSLGAAFNKMAASVKESYAALRKEVDERERAEKTLRRSEQQFRRVVETMNEGLCVEEEGGFITYVNDKLCRMLGCSSAHLIGRSATFMLDPAEWLRYDEELARRKLGLNVVFEARLMAVDEGKIPAILASSPIFDDTGRFNGAVTTIMDITILKEAEKKVMESEQKYRMIFESSPLGIIHFDGSGTITACNERISIIGGFPREQLIGFKLTVDLRDPAMAAAVWDCMSGSSSHFEGEICLVTGAKSTTIKADFGPIQDRDGSLLGGIGIIEDISQRKKDEEALRHSEEQLRFLSARLLTTQEAERKRIVRELHDSIGSSLTAIKFGVENTIGAAENGQCNVETLVRLVPVIQEAIDESRRIMTDLRPSILDDLGIVATIRWLCRKFQSIYSMIHIEEQIDITEEDIPKEIKTTIFRILQEALNNVAKYSRAEFVEVSLVRKASRIELTVEDNGMGFQTAACPSADARKGLGLTSMKERAELSGGSFCIRSIPGKGTSLRAIWPVLRISID